MRANAPGKSSQFVASVSTVGAVLVCLGSNADTRIEPGAVSDARAGLGVLASNSFTERRLVASRHLVSAGATWMASVEESIALHAESQSAEAVPRGTVTQYRWTDSRVFPDTQREYWVYVPAQYDGSQPACVMVFQDGGSYVDPKGSWKVPAVFDKLIYLKEMPVTIGVFINAGTAAARSSHVRPQSNRLLEYYSPGDRYARFLLDEILPHVGKSYRLAQDGNSRAISGSSAGASAAFTVAWERPDAFSRVLSNIGVHIDRRGAHEYVPLIRKTEPKALRIFLQDGSNDWTDYIAGNVWISNQDMLSALQFAGYEVLHEWGDGGHDYKSGAAVLPEALRWLWRDYPSAISAGNGSRQYVTKIISTSELWQAVTKGYVFKEGLAASASGDIFFADAASGRLYSVGSDGEPRVFANHASGTARLAFGPEGQLFAAEPGARRIVAYDMSARRKVVTRGVVAQDLAVTAVGHIYASEPSTRSIWLVDERRSRVVDRGLAAPRGVQLSPDESTLYVADLQEHLVYSFRIQDDGSLTDKQPYCFMQLSSTQWDNTHGSLTMAVDTKGRLYVTTPIGVQVCGEEAGRAGMIVTGIILGPSRSQLTQVAFGTKTFDWLYGISNDTLFRRKTKVTGSRTVQATATSTAQRR